MTALIALTPESNADDNCVIYGIDHIVVMADAGQTGMYISVANSNSRQLVREQFHTVVEMLTRASQISGFIPLTEEDGGCIYVAASKIICMSAGTQGRTVIELQGMRANVTVLEAPICVMEGLRGRNAIILGPVDLGALSPQCALKRALAPT